MDTTSPGDVVLAVALAVSRLVAGGLDPTERAQQLDDLAALYDEETDVRHPFSPLGDTPLRTRAELRHHFADAPTLSGRSDAFAPAGAVVHQTVDPEVAVVELRYAGTAGGRPFSIPFTVVARVRDGQIVESHDYADHVAFARVFGRLGGLADALRAGADV
ncbi:MAG TPA: nuclear transport factor 2 family protein [Iamia sp.]|nr:nuclear transport factor 2 family protein [Iamia sp.]